MKSFQEYLLKSQLKGIFFLLFFVSFFAFNSWGQPMITSFTPASGPVGTSITITGSNFSSTVANNIVFFGAVKGTVTAASATTLTVTAPFGTTFQPITVTVNNLTAYSSKPFIVTFSGVAPQFTSQSFEYAAHIDSADSNIETTKYSIGDIDNDGKIDVITVDRLNNTMSVYRNTTTGGVISFSPKIDFATNLSPRAVAIADIDGDGKLDIMVSNLNANTVSVFKNTSTSSIVSFEPKVDFVTAAQPSGISVTDMDKDGKPDLVVNTVNFEGYVSVLRNTSTGGTISFSPKIDLQSLGGSVEEIKAADIDGDGKMDIALPNFNSNSITIFRNTSSAGNLSFAPKVDIGTNSLPYQIEIGDLNEDGKPDIALGLYYSGYTYILRNTSTPGTISFNNETSYWIGGKVDGVTINDLDGDGKPDLAVNNGSDAVALYKNISSAGGNISFNPGIMYNSPWNKPVITGDFDSDGKPDMAFKSGIQRVTIWRNRITAPQIISFTPASAALGMTVDINGFNFTDINSVSFGGVPSASFTIMNASTIKAVVGTGASGDIKVVSASDSGSLMGFQFLGPPVILSFTPNSGTAYEKITIKGQNFTGATEVKFGGVSTTFNVIDPSTIEAYIGTGASGDVTVINPAGTATKSGFIYIPKPFINSFSPNQAISGSTITISGLNFSGVTSVSFGSTPAASFAIIDSNTIQAIVGVGSSGNVSVTNAFGTFIKSGFIYYPPPVITSFTPIEAAQGDTVTISGFNFMHDYYNSYITAVKFGGVSAFSFTVIDSFTIKAKVHGGASGVVTIESYRGNSSLDGFTFIPKPYITSVSPTIVGSGSEVTINGANFSNVTDVTFGNIPASSFIVVSSATIKAIVDTGATGNVTVITQKHEALGGPVEFTTNPVIYKILPATGPVGTTVTISGANFQSGATNNIVYFGGVKANAISASSNIITVSVPPGATYRPISVTSLSNNLTAHSNDRFDVTFPVDTTAFNDSSFAGKTDFATGAEPYDVNHGDLDGDGRLDMVIINHSSTFLSVYRNISSPGRLSFSTRIDKEIGISAKALAIADINGDGKLDLIVSSDGVNPKIYIYRNQSTPGNIAFVNAYEIGGFYVTAGFIETADFDLDGRQDIVFLCTNCEVAHGGVFVAKNTGSVDNISFSGPMLFGFNIPVSSGISTGLTVTDFNHDGKPDIIVGLNFSSGIFLLKNQSNIGSFIFFTTSSIGNVYSSDGYYSLTPYTATFSSPDYPDMISGKFVYKNNSGNFSQLLQISASVRYVYDLNGDGKQDILGNDFSTGLLSLLKNNCTNSSISFSPAFNTNVEGGNVIVEDLDGDSKPEICILYRSSNILRVLRNRMGEPMPQVPKMMSFSPQSAANLDQVIITGTDLSQVSSVTFGGTPALYYTILSQDSIVATIGNGASGKVVLTNPAGKDSLAGFTYLTQPAPFITSLSTTSSNYLGSVTIYGSHFENATSVKFGNTPANSFVIQSSTTIEAIVGWGSTGNVTIETPGGTAVKEGFTFYFPPVINSATPLNGTTGTVVTIAGKFNLPNTVTFGGVPASSFWQRVNAEDTIYAVVGNGASGDIVVSANGGKDTLLGFIYNVVTAIEDVNNNSLNQLYVYPNPAHDNVTIKHPFSVKKSYLQLVDVNGRIVKIISAGQSIQTAMPLKSITPGLYQVIWTDEKKILRKTLIIL